MTTPEERAQRIYKSIDFDYGDEAMIAAEMRAAVAEALRWIPVSERVPDNRETVIVLLSDVNQLRLAGQYASGKWGVWGFSHDDPDGPDPSVVAWQPMPPLPTKEQPND